MRLAEVGQIRKKHRHAQIDLGILRARTPVFRLVFEMCRAVRRILKLLPHRLRTLARAHGCIDSESIKGRFGLWSQGRFRVDLLSIGVGSGAILDPLAVSFWPSLGQLWPSRVELARIWWRTAQTGRLGPHVVRFGRLGPPHLPSIGTHSADTRAVDPLGDKLAVLDRVRSRFGRDRANFGPGHFWSVFDHLWKMRYLGVMFWPMRGIGLGSKRGGLRVELVWSLGPLGDDLGSIRGHVAQ